MQATWHHECMLYEGLLTRSAGQAPLQRDAGRGRVRGVCVGVSTVAFARTCQCTLLCWLVLLCLLGDGSGVSSRLFVYRCGRLVAGRSVMGGWCLVSRRRRPLALLDLVALGG